MHDEVVVFISEKKLKVGNKCLSIVKKHNNNPYLCSLSDHCGRTCSEMVWGEESF